MKTLENIIIINDFDFINGGTSQIAINTANALASNGYNVLFFSAVSDASKTDLSQNVNRYCTYQYDILNHPNRLSASLQGIWNKESAQQLKSLLENLNPEKTVVHIHGWIKALSPSIGGVLKKSGFKVIITLHDYFIACPNGGFFNYRTNRICHLIPLSLTCICTNCDARSYPQKTWRVLRQGIQRAIGHIPDGIKHFIAVTKFSENILRPYLPKGSIVHNISNPVNYPFDLPRRTDIHSNRLLFVGRLSPEKGIMLACEAARLSTSKLVVVGDGPLKETLQKQYPEVEFKGWLNPVQVFEEMLHATALVFSSILYETQGLAVLEAFSVGLPVIVSDKCAASELINDQNGVLFKSSDVDDLASKMKTIVDELSKTDEKSMYIFENYWKKPCTVENYLNQLIDTYVTILNE